MFFQNIVSEAAEIAVIKDGEREVYASGEERFDEIVAAWSLMTEGALIMPAFGVSIDELTCKAMKSGVWVEFRFAQKLEYEQLTFEKMLVEVRPDYCGFNINRYNGGTGYSGRCVYIDLHGGNMSVFYKTLTSN